MKTQETFAPWRRAFRVLLSLCCVLCLTLSCEGDKLAEAVERANSHCPYEMGKSGRVESVSLQDGYVVFRYDLTQSPLPFETLRTTIGTAHERIEMLLSDPDGDTRELLSLIASEGKGIRYIFTSQKAGSPIEAEITSKDIAAFLSPKKAMPTAPPKTETKSRTPVATNDELLAAIRSANATYPQALGNGIRLDSIELEGKFLVFHSSLAEEEISIKTVEDHADGVKKSMLTLLRHSPFLRLCQSYGKGLIFRYHGERSGKTFGIILSPEEMAT